MPDKRDYYEILGVSKTASADEIKSAYRKLAMQHHPDRNQGSKQAEEKFKEVSAAFEILGDPQKRAQYDQFGHSAFQYAGAGGQGYGDVHHAEDVFRSFMESFGNGGGFEDLFGDIFGGGGGGQRRRRVSRGSDIEVSMEISFEEAAFGAEKVISIPRYDTCKLCHGQGSKPGTKKITCPQCGGRGQVISQAGFMSIARTCPKCEGEGEIIQHPCTECRGQGRVKKEKRIDVKIPAGVDTGTRVRISGEGEAGPRGSANGDLYILLYVKKHPVFLREGNDIICDLPITFAQAALGADVEVPTLDGKVKMTVPAGTQSHRTLRLKGKGVKDVHGYERGDQLVRVIVEVPVRLNARQKETLQEFARSGGGATPAIDAFLEKIKKVFR